MARVPIVHAPLKIQNWSKGGHMNQIIDTPQGSAKRDREATRTSSIGVNTSAFWERLWRMSGINFVVFFIAAYVIYGYQPQVGASADALVAFYHGDRTRILIAAVFSGLTVLNLLWFAAALRTTLADAGQDGWGAAVTASSAALGGLFLLLITVGAVLAYSIAGSGNSTLIAGVNDFAWSCVVLTSFPRAMLIMAGTFGLWRAGAPAIHDGAHSNSKITTV